MKSLTLAYCAGFFDGEGCVYINRFQNQRHTAGITWQLQISVTNSNKEPLEKFQSYFGGRIRKQVCKKIKRFYWTWVCAAKTASLFLEAILPYSIVKKDEIILGLQFQSTMTRDRNRLSPELILIRQNCYDKMKEAKKKNKGTSYV